ncbi:MAG: MBOAT family protein [Methylobacteriaceae bacterium]|nr:MBOAT family protein [Methylobacteriaceae bacterium]
MPQQLTFNSFPFLLFFLPGVYLGYRLLLGTRWVNLWLCLASLYFYATSGVYYLIPLLFTCIFDYFVGQKIGPDTNFPYKRVLFVASVSIQIGLLSFFKYYDWLAAGLQPFLSRVGLAFALPIFPFILPPGISFYTFHTISYTADIYRGRFKPHNRLIDYITFVTLFPQLVAGPIARAADLLPQVAARRPPISWPQWETCIWLIAWGLCKKIVMADNLGRLVTLLEPHLAPGSVSPGAGLLFAYCFAGQIYCDFSAYTDIARGVAKLFNIELTRNFLTPYFSSSPTEFWRRWHISLSTWLRDYLYIPLGGDRHGRLKTLRNLGITMFLGGLWHGAGVGFIVWGLYHGLLLVAYRVLLIEERILRALGGRLGKAVAVILMFHLVCIGWIFFRATASELLPAFQSIPLLVGNAPDWRLVIDIGWGMVLFGAPVVITEVLAYRSDAEFVDLYKGWSWPVRSILYVCIFYAIVFFGARQQNEFIYFQF